MQLARRRTMAEVFTTVSYRRAPTKTKEALCPGGSIPQWHYNINSSTLVLDLAVIVYFFYYTKKMKKKKKESQKKKQNLMVHSVGGI